MALESCVALGLGKCAKTILNSFQALVRAKGVALHFSRLVHQMRPRLVDELAR